MFFNILRVVVITLCLSVSLGAKTLFVVYDAGPTNALKPVMESLDKKGKDYAILAFATAANLLKNHPKLLKVSLEADTSNAAWHRSTKLQKEDLDVLNKVIQSDASIDKVVAGLSSMIEIQVLDLCASKKRIAYYDSFSVLPGDYMPILHDFLKMEKTTLLVPLKNVKEDIQKLNQSQHIEIVGQPTLTTWLHERKKNRPTLLYIGNYENNNNGYEDSVKLFIDAIKDLDANVFISIHPKSDGSFEKSIVEPYAHIQAINSKDFKTEKLVHALHRPIVVTQRSTAAVQAYFSGYPIVYLDTQKGKYSNMLIERKKAQQCFDKRAFLDALTDLSKKNEANNKKTHNPFNDFSVPVDSVAAIEAVVG